MRPRRRKRRRPGGSGEGMVEVGERLGRREGWRWRWGWGWDGEAVMCRRGDEGDVMVIFWGDLGSL